MAASWCLRNLNKHTIPIFKAKMRKRSPFLSSQIKIGLHGKGQPVLLNSDNFSLSNHFPYSQEFITCILWIFIISSVTNEVECVISSPDKNENC